MLFVCSACRQPVFRVRGEKFHLCLRNCVICDLPFLPPEFPRADKYPVHETCLPDYQRGDVMLQPPSMLRAEIKADWDFGQDKHHLQHCGPCARVTREKLYGKAARRQAYIDQVHGRIQRLKAKGERNMKKDRTLCSWCHKPFTDKDPKPWGSCRHRNCKRLAMKASPAYQARRELARLKKILLAKPKYCKHCGGMIVPDRPKHTKNWHMGLVHADCLQDYQREVMRQYWAKKRGTPVRTGPALSRKEVGAVNQQRLEDIAANPESYYQVKGLWWVKREPDEQASQA